VRFRIGELDQRVKILKEARASDGMGGSTRTWEEVANVAAHVRPLSGRERARADRLDAEGGYMVAIRWRPDVRENMVIEWLNRDRRMNIRHVDDGGGRSMYLSIQCDTGVAT